MKNRNCPNCGSPYDTELNKCPYCNTSYFDMSCIDIDNNEPFYMKIKVGDKVVTQKVIAELGGIEIKYEPVYAYNSFGRIMAFNGGCNCTTNISFRAIPDNHNTMYTVTND